jgi:molybdopterin-guanine dinucleotide biosynthesis protein A
MVAKEQLTLAILAGGKGTRLGGVDKGQLRCEGRTLIDRLRDLEELCCDTLIVKDDVVPGKGAPGGVVTALVQAKTPYVLIVCCDMPRVTVDAVRALRGGFTCFEGQPFPGIYPVARAAEWKRLLEWNPSMHQLIAGATQVPLTDPNVVRSVNTPEDAKSLGVDIP